MLELKIETSFFFSNKWIKQLGKFESVIKLWFFFFFIFFFLTLYILK